MFLFIVLYKRHDLNVGFPDNIKLNQGRDPVSARIEKTGISCCACERETSASQ